MHNSTAGHQADEAPPPPPASDAEPPYLPWPEVRRIAFLCRPYLGDFVLTLPAVQYCRRVCPQAEITLYGYPAHHALLPYLTGFDHFVTLNSKRPQVTTQLLAAWRGRSKRFDVAIDTKDNPSRGGAFFLRCLGARYRVAYTHPDTSRRLVNWGVPYEPSRKTDSHYAAKVLRLVSGRRQEVDTSLYPRLTLPATIGAQLSGEQARGLHGLSRATPILLISASINRHDSFFGCDGYSTLLNQAYQEQPFSVLVSCLPADVDKAKRIVEHLDMPSVVMITTRLDQFLAVLSAVDVCLVGDGGIMHLAAALDKPQVVLFGRTSPVEWFPLSNKAVCLFDPNSVTNLAAEDILAALRGVLEKNVKRPPLSLSTP